MAAAAAEKKMNVDCFDDDAIRGLLGCLCVFSFQGHRNFAVAAAAAALKQPSSRVIEFEESSRRSHRHTANTLLYILVTTISTAVSL